MRGPREYVLRQSNRINRHTYRKTCIPDSSPTFSQGTVRNLDRDDPVRTSKTIAVVRAPVERVWYMYTKSHLYRDEGIAWRRVARKTWSAPSVGYIGGFRGRFRLLWEIELDILDTTTIGSSNIMQQQVSFEFPRVFTRATDRWSQSHEQIERMCIFG